jgi:hypothetical protein
VGGSERASLARPFPPTLKGAHIEEGFHPLPHHLQAHIPTSCDLDTTREVLFVISSPSVAYTSHHHLSANASYVPHINLSFPIPCDPPTPSWPPCHPPVSTPCYLPLTRSSPLPTIHHTRSISPPPYHQPPALKILNNPCQLHSSRKQLTTTLPTSTRSLSLPPVHRSPPTIFPIPHLTSRSKYTGKW